LDGFAAGNEVKRLGKAKLVRYFELLDASENTAPEAARAYLDVIRYREQVKLAGDNYLQRYAAHEQLECQAREMSESEGFVGTRALPARNAVPGRP
jgi:hypothetical protein